MKNEVQKLGAHYTQKGSNIECARYSEGFKEIVLQNHFICI